MLLGAVGISLEISLAGDSDLFFLYPSDPQLGPADDTVIEGSVWINLAVSQRVGALRVALIGSQRLQLGDKTETSETLRQQVDVDISDKRLPAGKHQFTFSLRIPANTAPSERCPQGSVQHHLVASLPDTGFLGSIVKTESRVLLQVSHASERNGYAPSFSMQREIFHDQFGAMRVELSSRFLLVSAYIRLHVFLPQVLRYVRVQNIQVDLIQKVALRSAKESGSQQIEQHTSEHTLWCSAADPTGPLHVHVVHPYPGKDGEEPYYLSRQMRLPDDNTISSSSHRFSQGGIRISHSFTVKIIFLQYSGPESGKLKGDGEPAGKPSRQLLEFSSPATISSCSCRIELNTLPTYEESSKKLGCNHISSKDVNLAENCLCKQVARKAEFTETMYGVSREEVGRMYEESEQLKTWAFETAKRKAAASEVSHNV